MPDYQKISREGFADHIGDIKECGRVFKGRWIILKKIASRTNSEEPNPEYQGGGLGE